MSFGYRCGRRWQNVRSPLNGTFLTLTTRFNLLNQHNAHLIMLTASKVCSQKPHSIFSASSNYTCQSYTNSMCFFYSFQLQKHTSTHTNRKGAETAIASAADHSLETKDYLFLSNTGTHEYFLFRSFVHSLIYSFVRSLSHSLTLSLALVRMCATR